MNAVRLAVVVIGRNEGERLRKCLSSIMGSSATAIVVYVDSGSTDGSVQFATSLGCVTVSLDMTLPFTAARARNEGFASAILAMPDLEYVQFVDGDCEVVEGWLERALDFLQENLGYVAVCGRRRERYPDRSIFNRMCDFEWDIPVGAVKAFGGDVMLRAVAFRDSGGYRANLIAGEEPELCVRLRAAGWRIERIDCEMTKHDANMLHFSQWWKRSKRTGHAFAEGSVLHGAPPERHWVRESRSVWFWGLVVPMGIAVLALTLTPWLLLALAVYPAQVLRMYLRDRGVSRKPLWHAALLLVGKFPEMLGQVSFFLNRALGKLPKLIEYK